MLRLNHPRFNTICVGRQERSKRQQSAAAHIRQALLLHLTAKTGVEHPLRNLQRSQPVQLVSHATENYTPASSRFGSNAYWLSIPWMPAITHFSNAGFMGVLYPSCTTPSVHTLRWATDRQRRQHGRPRLPSGMEKWKAKNASHFPTPPTTATGRYLTLPLRYTNNLDGTNYRAGHVEEFKTSACAAEYLHEHPLRPISRLRATGDSPRPNLGHPRHNLWIAL